MTAPEVPHADLIEARVRFTTTPCTRCGGWEQHVYVTKYMTDDGLVTSELRGLTNANHERGCTLGDTVPREQYDAIMLVVDEQVRAAERERDEARAERDALAHVIEQVRNIHQLGLWHEAPTASGSSDGHWHGGCTYCETDSPCSTRVLLDAAPAVSLAVHDAEVSALAVHAAARELRDLPPAERPRSWEVVPWLMERADSMAAEATAGQDQQ